MSRVYNPAPEQKKNGSQIPDLPELDDAADLISNPPEVSEEVIRGMLRRGQKGVFGGSSKSFKTWNLAGLAISVASGEPWLDFETVQGPVLYCQLENQKAGFAHRLKVICEARGITLEKDFLRVWNLRGHTSRPERIISGVIEKAKGTPFSLVIFDPLYKLTAGLDENAAGDMAKGLAPFDMVAEQTGAAVVYGHHFSKGNQAGKDSIDRMSGSGVFARDADAIITLTRHEEDDAFTVEPILREYPPVEPFVLRWSFPLMERDGSLDPAKLKQPKMGRSKSHTEDDALRVLQGAGSLKTNEWKDKCQEEEGISHSTFHRLRRILEKQRKVKKSKVEEGEWIAA